MSLSTQAKIKADKLYAAYASYREERGGRPYWLVLRTKSKALAGKTIKVPGGTTIAKNQYYIEAQLVPVEHSATTNGTSVQAKYQLLPETVQVPVSTLVQEHELEWEHEGRSGAGGESTLKEKCHAIPMQHNYSNVPMNHRTMLHDAC